MQPQKSKLITWIALAVLVTVILFVYIPGLNSPFYLDDSYNLKGLADINLYGYLGYIFSGISSHLGRPLSLLSFALQYQDWPQNPEAFKRVNLFIHLLNTVAVFTLIKLLIKENTLPSTNKIFISISVAAIWALHPVQVTTVLYTVQRMTELSALFTLLGAIFYIWYRNKYGSQNINEKIMFVVIFYGLLLLSILSKENGILLPLLLLVYEITIGRAEKPDKKYPAYYMTVLMVPLLMLLIYLVTGFSQELQSYGYREFSMGQRLLTELVVLREYILAIIWPFTGSFSLFHDDHWIANGSILQLPVFLSAIFHTCLISAAIIFRKKYPHLLFGILWFYAGQVLESGYLNLEIYFEHRNYLPAFGIIYSFIWLLIIIDKYIHGRWIIPFVFVYICLTGFKTASVAKLWSDPFKYAYIMVQEHPQSARAIANMARQQLINGDTRHAILTLEYAEKLFSDDIYPGLKIIDLKSCVLHETPDPQEWQKLLKLAPTFNRDRFDFMGEINLTINTVESGDCSELDLDNMEKLIMAIIGNTHYHHYQANLYQLLSFIKILQGDYQSALHYINVSISAGPSITRVLFKIRLLMSGGNYTEAKQELKKLDNSISVYSREHFVYGPKISKFKTALAKQQ